MFKSPLQNVQIFVTKCSNLGCKNSAFYFINASNIFFYAKKIFSTTANKEGEPLHSKRLFLLLKYLISIVDDYLTTIFCVLTLLPSNNRNTYTPAGIPLIETR